MKRRELIAMGLAAGGSARFSMVRFLTPPSAAEISNQYLRAQFDPQSGLFHAWFADGSPFLVNAAIRAVAPSGTHNSSDPSFHRKSRVERTRDSLGSGAKIIAECVDEHREFTLGLEISLYDNRNALIVESTFHNDSTKSLFLRALEPLRAVSEENSLCIWKHASRSITNGFLYTDPGNLNDFSQSRMRHQKSVWNIGFAGEELADPGLAAGYIESDFAIGTLEAAVASHGALSGLSLFTEAEFNREFIVKPGEIARSGRFALQIAPNPFAALENYAQIRRCPSRASRPNHQWLVQLVLRPRQHQRRRSLEKCGIRSPPPETVWSRMDPD